MDPETTQKKRATESKIAAVVHSARENLDVDWQQEIKETKIKEIGSMVRKALEEDDDGRGFVLRLTIPPSAPAFAVARARTVKIWREICLAVAEEEGFEVDAPKDGELNANVYVAYFK